MADIAAYWAMLIDAHKLFHVRKRLGDVQDGEACSPMNQLKLLRLIQEHSE